MHIEIREADLGSDSEGVIEALRRWLTPRSDHCRYEWLYRGSPHGSARVWLAVSQHDGTIVGAAAAFPRRLYVRGTEVLGCVYGDFCVAPEHRSLGLALRLQRACFESTESGWANLAYDFPSAGMMVVYKRLKCGQSETFVRMARPLRVDRKVRDRIRIEPLARAVSRAGNTVLSLTQRASYRASGWDISLHEGLCGEEFSTLARDLRGSDRVCVARSAPYLNWRYLAHPFYRHEVLTARRSGRLEGYLVFHQDGEGARIVDLFGHNQDEMFAALLASACEQLHTRGTATVSAPIIASHARAATLRRSGFRPRESSDIVFFARPNGAVAAPGDWFLMDGDRDS